MEENVSQVSNLRFDSDLGGHSSSPDVVKLSDYSSMDPDPNFASEGDSPSDDGDFSDTVLKYINQMLMEEDMEAKPCMFHDPLALQAAEKSLYEALGEKYPPSRHQQPLCSADQSAENPEDGFSGNAGDSSTGISVNSFSALVDPVDYNNPSALQNPVPANLVFQSSSRSYNSISELLVPNSSGENELMLQFKRGLEEGSKFLPKASQLVIDLETYDLSPGSKGKKGSDLLVKVEKDEGNDSPCGFRGRKYHEREESGLEDGRSNKQLAVYTEETEISELFDKVLLCNPGCTVDESYWENEANKPAQQGGRSNGTSGGTTHSKIQDNNKEVVDLRTLLISCAQAVSANDVRTAYEQLKQIRQHSSPFGDGSQRLAHCFANGLEARLAGTGSEIYATLTSKITSAADMLKVYQAYISICPFKKIATSFANQMIGKAAEKATTLHIIDFGIFYGFQWPAFIHCLSRRSGGRPKLRITGIDLPQHGFRPAERVQETGHRLERYCERFGVPFEYNAIAKTWETIQVEDFKIERNEVLAVNCLLRFKNLLDETVVTNSPRDAVLKLIRKIKPDIFVHAIVNGAYNSPFFVTRFREALFNFSSWFDITDATLAHEDPMRLMFEKEFLGREVINVVACEGSERVERPETYKQWQVRNMRAGFRQLPLDPELVKKSKDNVKRGYHSDFVVEEDGNWMLQGWKGRVLQASSCWVPA